MGRNISSSDLMGSAQRHLPDSQIWNKGTTGLYHGHVCKLCESIFVSLTFQSFKVVDGIWIGLLDCAKVNI